MQYVHDFIIYHDDHKNIVTIKITDNMNYNEPARQYGKTYPHRS